MTHFIKEQVGFETGSSESEADDVKDIGLWVTFLLALYLVKNNQLCSFN